MKQNKKMENDLEDTVKRPIFPLKDQHTKKDPIWILFPFVAKVGIILALILAITLGMRAAYIFLHGIDISLLSTETPNFQGNNGVGIPNADFHPETKAIITLQNAQKEKARKEQDTQSLNTLISSIHCSFSQAENLSNGMVIRYSCTYNHQAAKKAKYNFKNTSRSYTVRGLSALKELDPFENLETTWDNTNTIPTLLLKPNATCEALGIQYTYSYNSATTAHVTISYHEQELKEKGYYIAKNNTETDLSFVPPSILLPTNLDAQILDTLDKYVVTDLSKCQTYAFGKERITAEDPHLISLQQVDDHLEITFSLTNVYSKRYPNYYQFTISYEGVIYRDVSGVVSFLTNTKHTCHYDGFQQNYTIEKDVSCDTP